MRPVIHVPGTKSNHCDPENMFSLSRKPSILQLSSPRNVLATTRQSPIQDPFLNMRQFGTSSPKLRPICPLKHLCSGTQSLNSSKSQRCLGIEKQSKPLSVPELSNKKRVLARNNSACVFPPISTRNSKPIRESKNFAKELKDIQLRIPILREDFLTKRDKRHEREKFDFRMSQREEPTTPYFSGNSQASFRKHTDINFENESTALPGNDETEFKLTFSGKAVRDYNVLEACSRLNNLISKEQGRRDSKELTFRYKK
ncbi:unnamed protein product [Blepharisma stoltei]|uniref:TPX2 central domain-containing protein n=1 Tax=Blepharisma stoltei TaxID=1481888 RepID=A0AAU9K9W5_9CILI|nr:unnamed protein product [Blepharisma stoltei]